MGYTHYWRSSREVETAEMVEALHAMKRIVDASPVPLAGWNGAGEPTLDESGLRFNGRGEEDSHETFVFGPGWTDFAFCKTARKPYDDVVTACLIAGKLTLGGGLRVRSDGDPADWRAGYDLAADVLGSDVLDGTWAAVEADLVGPSWL